MSDTSELDAHWVDVERKDREARETDHLIAARGALAGRLRHGDKPMPNVFDADPSLPVNAIAYVEGVVNAARVAKVIGRWLNAIDELKDGEPAPRVQTARAIIEAVIEGRREYAVDLAVRAQRHRPCELGEILHLIFRATEPMSEAFRELFAKAMKTGPEIAKANEFYQSVFGEEAQAERRQVQQAVTSAAPEPPPAEAAKRKAAKVSRYPNETRDKWIYDRVSDHGVSSAKIVEMYEKKAVERGWRPPTMTWNGLKGAAERYARIRKKPTPPKRKGWSEQFS
jgi:hypothetical protein